MLFRPLFVINPIGMELRHRVLHWGLFLDLITIQISRIP